MQFHMHTINASKSLTGPPQQLEISQNADPAHLDKGFSDLTTESAATSDDFGGPGKAKFADVLSRWKCVDNRLHPSAQSLPAGFITHHAQAHNNKVLRRDDGD